MKRKALIFIFCFGFLPNPSMVGQALAPATPFSRDVSVYPGAYQEYSKDRFSLAQGEALELALELKKQHETLQPLRSTIQIGLIIDSLTRRLQQEAVAQMGYSIPHLIQRIHELQSSRMVEFNTVFLNSGQDFKKQEWLFGFTTQRARSADCYSNAKKTIQGTQIEFDNILQIYLKQIFSDQSSPTLGLSRQLLDQLNREEIEALLFYTLIVPALGEGHAIELLNALFVSSEQKMSERLFKKLKQCLKDAECPSFVQARLTKQEIVEHFKNRIRFMELDRNRSGMTRVYQQLIQAIKTVSHSSSEYDAIQDMVELILKSSSLFEWFNAFTISDPAFHSYLARNCDRVVVNLL